MKRATVKMVAIQGLDKLMEEVSRLTREGAGGFMNMVEYWRNTYSCDVYEEGRHYLVMMTDKTPLNEITRHLVGPIFEKDTNQLVCYGFSKTMDETRPVEEVLKESGEYTWSQYIEGTLIRLWYDRHDGVWRFSTNKKIDAFTSTWKSKKSFGEMLLDVIQLNAPKLFSRLRRENTYVFMVKHPENNMIVQYKSPNAVHVGTFNMETLSYVDHHLGYHKLGLGHCRIETSDMSVERYTEARTGDWKNIGLLYVKPNGERYRMMNETYTKMREVLGKAHYIEYRYLELRGEGKGEEFVKMFPMYESVKKYVESAIFNLAVDLHKTYVGRHITKSVTNEKIEYYFKPLVYELHGKFLQDHEKVSMQKVLEYINTLPTRRLSFVLQNMGRVQLFDLPDYEKAKNEFMEDEVRPKQRKVVAKKLEEELKEVEDDVKME